MRNETEAEALERMEQEIEEHEDVIFAMQACEQNRIDNVLMGGQEPIDLNLGGLSIILFGDFNQLKPIMDTWIFNERVRHYAYKNLVAGAVASGLWQKFDIYCLTEIMRQANDKEFAQALTTLGKYGLL